MSSSSDENDHPSRHQPTNRSSTPGPLARPDTSPSPREVEPPPPPRQAPEPSFVDRIPSIKLSVPPRGTFQSHPLPCPRLKGIGRFSPSTSERCFTYCSQSHLGRAHGHEPKCYTFCLRRIFSHEVNRILTNVNYGPIMEPPTIPVNIPLPQEASTTLGQYISDSTLVEASDDSTPRTPPPSQPENERRHWQEGYYAWLSRSRQAASEHMSHMKRDLFQQSSYERCKAMWAQAVREGRQHEFYRTPEAQFFGSEWTANMHEDILYVNSSSFSPRSAHCSCDLQLSAVSYYTVPVVHASSRIGAHHIQISSPDNRCAHDTS